MSLYYCWDSTADIKEEGTEHGLEVKKAAEIGADLAATMMLETQVYIYITPAWP